MKVIKCVSNLLKEVARSRVAWIFFSLHLILLLLASDESDRLFSYYHTNNEPTLFQVLAIINTPAILVVSVLFLPIKYLLSFFYPTEDELRKWLIISFYIGWQIQWALIGYGIEKLFKRNRKRLFGNKNYH